jgi:hypothetical protein
MVWSIDSCQDGRKNYLDHVGRPKLQGFACGVVLIRSSIFLLVFMVVFDLKDRRRESIGVVFLSTTDAAISSFTPVAERHQIICPSGLHKANSICAVGRYGKCILHSMARGGWCAGAVRGKDGGSGDREISGTSAGNSSPPRSRG